MARQSLALILRSITHKGVDDLTIDQTNLLNLLVLIVDIKYKLKYGCQLQSMGNKNATKKILPDQLPLVDCGLEDVSQRRVSDANDGPH